MTDRILEISDTPARLSARNSLLVINAPDRDEVTLPFADLAVLIVSHPQVSYTQAVLAELVAAGGAFVACDKRHLPVGMLLPLDAHYVQTERFALQAQAPLPMRKRLWQEIVRAKVRAQGYLLESIHGSDLGLFALAAAVRSGDPSNVEAQASRRYWPALFDDPAFRRDRDRLDQNRLLNYGYAILRAVVSRSIAAAGLHPSLGLHHHNRYNSFCLADDLMEPFRPVVDKAVYELIRDGDPAAPMDRPAKTALLEAVTGRVRLNKESRSLFDAASIAASSLVAVLNKQAKRLVLPENPCVQADP
jgi:CRISPR-associated protein Cas1